MKHNKVLLSALVTVMLTYTGHADIVASYDAGVSPTAGTTGAADPTTQGWAVNNNVGNSFLSGEDSTIGGWRITDATGSGFYFLQHDLTGSEAADMATLGWTATWTTAVSHDAVSDAGVPNGVNNYYDAGSNQSNNSMWIEVAGNFLYVLTHTADGNNDIQFTDGTNTFQVTNTGSNLSEELGTGAPSAFYVTYTLSYDANTGTATLSDDQGNNHGLVAPAGLGSTNRVLWGATGSGSQGSTVWNELSVDTVPEPGSLALLSLSGLLIARRRRG